MNLLSLVMVVIGVPEGETIGGDERDALEFNREADETEGDADDRSICF